jgi:hypothetical protein
MSMEEMRAMSTEENKAVVRRFIDEVRQLGALPEPGKKP